MSPKAQHANTYRKLPIFLRNMREQAGMTQRSLGSKLGKPQSWIHSSEVANRRVDMMEFAAWAKACGIEPLDAFKRLLEGD
jgi:transcriptional regulator with XRE-family HTH domain